MRYLVIFLGLLFMLSCSKNVSMPEIEPPDGILMRLPELKPGFYYHQPCVILKSPFGPLGACFIRKEEKKRDTL